MEVIKQQAVAVLVRCKGYSRAMAENCLTTLTEHEIAALARAALPLLDKQQRLIEYVARDGVGEYVALVLDEIADRKELEERERKLDQCIRACQEKPLDQAPALDRIHAERDWQESQANLLASRQRRRDAAAALSLPGDAAAGEEDDDEPQPDDPTEIAEEVP